MAWQTSKAQGTAQVRTLLGLPYSRYPCNKDPFCRFRFRVPKFTSFGSFRKGGGYLIIRILLFRNSHLGSLVCLRFSETPGVSCRPPLGPPALGGASTGTKTSPSLEHLLFRCAGFKPSGFAEVAFAVCFSVVRPRCSGCSKILKQHDTYPSLHRFHIMLQVGLLWSRTCAKLTLWSAFLLSVSPSHSFPSSLSLSLCLSLSLSGPFVFSVFFYRD